MYSQRHRNSIFQGAQWPIFPVLSSAAFGSDKPFKSARESINLTLKQTGSRLTKVKAKATTKQS